MTQTLLTLQELLTKLSAPVDPEHLKTLSKSGSKLVYIPWYVVSDILDEVCPAWTFECTHVVTPTQLVTTGTLAILTADYGYISRSNVGIETLLETDKNGELREIAYGDAASNSYGMCFRRCAVMFGLGRYLYDKETVQAVVKSMTKPASTGKRSAPPGRTPNTQPW